MNNRLTQLESAYCSARKARTKYEFNRKLRGGMLIGTGILQLLVMAILSLPATTDFTASPLLAAIAMATFVLLIYSGCHQWFSIGKHIDALMTAEDALKNRYDMAIQDQEAS